MVVGFEAVVRSEAADEKFGRSFVESAVAVVVVVIDVGQLEEVLLHHSGQELFVV